MKRVVLTVADEAKFHILINFLREIQFVRIEEEAAGAVRKMTRLPQATLHPVTAENFTMFSRDELHERESFH